MTATATIDEMLSTLTLEEKASLLAGSDHWLTQALPQHGIAALLLCDGPHGLRKQEGKADHLGLHESLPATCFPTASTLACSFDPGLAREVGRAIGEECVREDVAVVLGPGMNIKRSPLGGRGFEYFSEDPFLTSAMATGMVEGIQSCGVGACLKHFACNSQEIARMVSDSIVDERALNEIYLRGFEKTVKKARPWAVMTAYNRLNGTYCSQSSALITDKLRDDWGFDGVCVTDWGALSDSVPSVAAGLDLVMPGPRADHAAEVVEAVKHGELSVRSLDAAARRLISLCRRYEDEAPARRSLPIPKHHLGTAQRAAEESAVLLENNGILPLDVHENIAVIGSFALRPRYQGAGSSRINPIALDDPWSALCNAGFDARYAKGYDPATGETTDELLDEARATARAAHIAVVIVGLPDRFESEGFDRSDITLPAGHEELLRTVCEANPRTVVVIQGGSPVSLPWLSHPSEDESHSAPQPAAVLLAGLAGCRGGAAIARLLLGEANPSGKLAETWPVKLEDTALGSNFPDKNRNILYRESIFVGYRWFDAAEIEPAYPFGHGLSYTRFHYDGLEIETCEGGVRVAFDLENAGDLPGSEVAQVYIADMNQRVFREARSLVGFAKVFLQPGRKERVVIDVSADDLSYWDTESGAWRLDETMLSVSVGASSRDIRLEGSLALQAGSAGFTLSPREGKHDDTPTAPACYAHVTRKGFDETSFAQLYGADFPAEKPVCPIDINSTVTEIDQTALGHLIFKIIEREARKTTQGDGGDTKAILDAMLADMPLRSMTMGGIPMEAVHAIVDLLNGHFIHGMKNGLKALRILNARSETTREREQDRKAR